MQYDNLALTGTIIRLCRELESAGKGRARKCGVGRIYGDDNDSIYVIWDANVERPAAHCNRKGAYFPYVVVFEDNLWSTGLNDAEINRALLYTIEFLAYLN